MIPACLSLHTSPLEFPRALPVPQRHLKFISSISIKPEVMCSDLYSSVWTWQRLKSDNLSLCWAQNTFWWWGQQSSPCLCRGHARVHTPGGPRTNQQINKSDFFFVPHTVEEYFIRKAVYRSGEFINVNSDRIDWSIKRYSKRKKLNWECVLLWWMLHIRKYALQIWNGLFLEDKQSKMYFYLKFWIIILQAL